MFCTLNLPLATVVPHEWSGDSGNWHEPLGNARQELILLLFVPKSSQ